MGLGDSRTHDEGRRLCAVSAIWQLSLPYGKKSILERRRVKECSVEVEASSQRWKRGDVGRMVDDAGNDQKRKARNACRCLNGQTLHPDKRCSIQHLPMPCLTINDWIRTGLGELDKQHKLVVDGDGRCLRRPGGGEAGSCFSFAAGYSVE